MPDKSALGLAEWLSYLLSAVFSPLFVFCAATALAIEDICFRLFGKITSPSNEPVRRGPVSVVIPTWNGLDLLQKYLPSVIRALSDNPAHEIIVVDNASRDGTVEYLAQHFPQVRVVAQKQNLGFGGGSNAGFAAAKHDVVVLLNNDMRVEPDFLAPLLAPFSDPRVFAVACQIYFADRTKRREETGLTETWWHRGRMAASHRVDPEVNAPFPCAYPGGGSSAFDRRKFLEIGGFDEVYRPFYYEDTDLGSMAWKRGWKVLYQPGSVVYHEHRGTIGKKFSRNHIDRVVQRNAVAFAWKNIHNWRMLAESLAYTFLTGLGGTLLGNRKGFHAAAALWGCTKRMPEIMRCRWRAKSLACVNDEEALKRQQGGYFRDRFDVPDIAPARLQVLFLSPYHIEPPTHGGGLSMQATIRALSAHVDVHLLCFVDSEKQIAPHEALESYCASMTFLVRKHISSQIVLGVRPRVAVEFDDPDFTWAMHRLILLRNIDVIQVEYTMLAQYACDFARIPQFLFEHDLAFQSLGRQLAVRRGARETFAYMQLLRFELESAKHFARIQVCSRENREYLLEFAPDLAGRVDGDMRAVIDTGAYPFASQGREPNSVLFIGSFNHLPNVHALDWLLTHVWPAVLKGNPEALLYIAGSGSSEPLRGKLEQPGVRLLGFVDDIMELLLHKAVLISPILSGSGVRMKLLEAFACGIPVVSTRLGAEGLTTVSDEICALADAPDEFAVAVLHLLKDPTYASGLASRARVMVERERDSTVATRKLVSSYLGEVTKRRPKSHAPLLIKGPEQESPSARKAVV